MKGWAIAASDGEWKLRERRFASNDGGSSGVSRMPLARSDREKSALTQSEARWIGSETLWAALPVAQVPRMTKSPRTFAGGTMSSEVTFPFLRLSFTPTGTPGTAHCPCVAELTVKIAQLTSRTNA